MDEIQVNELARRYTAAWCSQKPEQVASFFAAEGSLSINGGKPSVGRAEIAEAARGFMSAFPDLEVLMDACLQKEGKVIYRWTLVGTNTGPGGSGRPVRVSGFEEWTLGEDGLIAKSQGHFDSAEYDRQIAGAD